MRASQVVFSCSGATKRMSPLAGDKFLLIFMRKTLLEHHIEQALDAGLGYIILVGNRRSTGGLEGILQPFPQARICPAV